MTSSKIKTKITAVVIVAFAVIILGIGVGSVYILPVQVLQIFASKLFFNGNISDDMARLSVIILRVRLPRVLTAFICGGAFAMAGVIMQGCLKNLLASAYTIGVSSGASLFAACTLFFGAGFSRVSLPVAGSLGAVITVFAVVKFAQTVDRSLSDNTLILTGMIFSLFINAILTVIVSLNAEKLGKLLFWQMGNFAWHGWDGLKVMFPCTVIAFIFLFSHSIEADILTFGDERALSLGVQAQTVKKKLLVVSSLLIGIIVSFVGIIGFVDLIAPHAVRKFFGSKHKIVLPMSFLFGGILMVICDLIARTILSPRELAVGAVTAIIGAPFFASVYFSKRRSNA